MAESLRLSGFRIIFADEFETLSLRTGGPTQGGFAAGSGRWTPGFFFDGEPRGQTFWNNGELAFKINPGFPWRGGYPAQGQFSVADSILRIRAEKTPPMLLGQLPNDPNTGTQPSWISGVLTTRHSCAVGPPAYFEIRARMPGGKGLWPAFWAVASNNPAQREVDFLEFHGDKPDWISVAQHHAEHVGAQLQDEAQFCGRGADFTAGFHTFGCLWTQVELSFYIDGRKIHRMRANPLLDGILLFAMLDLSVGGHWPGMPDATTASPSEFLIDWFRIWGTDETRVVMSA